MAKKANSKNTKNTGTKNTGTKNKGINPSAARTRWAKPLGTTLDRLTKPMLGRKGFTHATIVTKWPEIVGENVARYTAPEKIVFSRAGVSGGTLHLRCETSAYAAELMHQEPMILDRINTFFGYQAVVRIQLVQGPLPRKIGRKQTSPPRPLSADDAGDIADIVAQVEDEELREVLTTLGHAVKSKNKK